MAPQRPPGPQSCASNEVSDVKPETSATRTAPLLDCRKFRLRDQRVKPIDRKVRGQRVHGATALSGTPRLPVSGDVADT